MQTAVSIRRQRRVTGQPRSCRGIILIEAVVALVVLMVAMATLAQLLSLAAQQRRLTEQRRLALEELANQAERISLIVWDDVTAEKLTTWQPSDKLLAVMPEPTCRASVTSEPGDLGARRIQLTVAWTDQVGQEIGPIDLTIWRFDDSKQPAKEAQP